LSHRIAVTKRAESNSPILRERAAVAEQRLQNSAAAVDEDVIDAYLMATLGGKQTFK
jgi:hypothetical protein